MEIKVLGTGCSKCKKLEAVVQEVIAKTGMTAQVLKVTDIQEIMSFGVMSTPALVIDEKLVLAGRVPSYDEVVTLLSRPTA
ncbi:MAG: TM0996/MTH895 family glutaredoxin-like protein [Coriobacteriia bacterium]|nr:TM0996/MTH895 family glutaredoxin-like protein [Coriobacteriia bacterium]